MEKVFLILSLVLFAIFGPFTYGIYHVFVDFNEKKPEGYRWPMLTDFWIMIVATVIYVVIELTFIKVLFPYYYMICKEKVDEKSRISRTKKGLKNAYKFMYFSFSTFMSYLMLKDTAFFPKSLGGSGDLNDYLKDWPYIEYPPYYKFCYMGSMGFHMGTIFTEVLFEKNKKKSDYIEMALHHFVTIYLLGFGYMS